MKTNSKFFLLAVLATALYSAQSYACDRESLAGTWSRSIPELGFPSATTVIILEIQGDTLKSSVLLTDDVTAGQMGGPYFESIVEYKTSLDEETCTLNGAAEFTTQKTYRNYDEPTPSVSTTIIPIPRTIRYRFTLSGDSTEITIDNGRDAPFSLQRKL